MTTANQNYYDWLINLISPQCNETVKQHYRLLENLYLTEFVPHPDSDLDCNRAEDGLYLRYLFSPDDDDTSPCSMLEMMIALAKRLEDNIMSDSYYGDRTGVWFWDMVSNLGLLEEPFDYKHYNDVMQNFLDRTYGYYGEGGLFYIPDSQEPVNKLDIWTQANWYLNKID